MTTTKTVPDQAGLKRIGETVRKRLASNPNAYKVPTDKAEIYAIGGVFSEAECRRLITAIDVVAQPSELFGLPYSEAYRTSYSGNFNASDPFVLGISRRIDDILGLPHEFGETIQGQRYLPGQEFKEHCDWFYTEETYWKQERKKGGQRSWTAMAFLNTVEKGGNTDFTEIGISITPKPGALLVWNNALPDGTPNEDTMHAGTPVEAGVKYVLTRWYRTRKWG